MQLKGHELVALAGILKAAQIAVAKGEKDDKPKKQKSRPKFTEAYPSFSRSILGQVAHEPRKAGFRRAAGTGAVGAILGALAARILSDNPALVGAGALGGGVLGAVPGYISGTGEAESGRSKLLFLKRLGITRPGELEALLQNPEIP